MQGAVPRCSLPRKARAPPPRPEHQAGRGAPVSHLQSPIKVPRFRSVTPASRPRAAACRPRLLGVVDSGDIKISGITLTGATRQTQWRCLLRGAALQRSLQWLFPSNGKASPIDPPSWLCRPGVLGVPCVSERASGHQRGHHPRRPRHPQQRWSVAGSSCYLLRRGPACRSCSDAAPAPPRRKQACSCQQQGMAHLLLRLPTSSRRTSRPPSPIRPACGAGIDVDGSRYVTIRDVDIDTADDAICIKSTGKWPTAHVTVTGGR